MPATLSPRLPGNTTTLEVAARKICVVVPTYNNAGTLATVIEQVLLYCRNVYVVNDGSTDSTSDVLNRYPTITTISYPHNAGKGWALRQGFAAAVNDGFDYAITLDSDGQHFAQDIPALVAMLAQTGPCLIIGARNMQQAGVPRKSSFGNKFSNFWFWIETGYYIPDTQSGYRLYPIRQLRNLHFFTRKFEFEIEVIVRAAWQGIKVISTPVQVYYASGEERITHFRPFTDFTRISLLNTALVIMRIIYQLPQAGLRKLLGSTVKVIAGGTVAANR
jgi:glycosyltransferase involved in cell wall biosynthesis